MFDDAVSGTEWLWTSLGGKHDIEPAVLPPTETDLDRILREWDFTTEHVQNTQTRCVYSRVPIKKLPPLTFHTAPPIPPPPPPAGETTQAGGWIAAPAASAANHFLGSKIWIVTCKPFTVKARLHATTVVDVSGRTR
jgi:hypothetical protein